MSFGDPAALDLATFTIETWFKRTGAGVSNTTGTAGIPNAIPLVTHGAPQSEGSNVDANWILVIDDATDVIAADFEDLATGQNHPVIGITPIVNDVWHHAAATYDGTTWRLYLDGNLENTLVVNQTPRSDSIQGSGLGAMFTSSGTALGHFDGTLDEVRVWNYARTQSQIQGTINSPITYAQAGLVARWGLNETTGTGVASSAGTNVAGTITNAGSSWVAGAPPIINHAPVVALAAPADLATDVSTPPSLSAVATDTDLDDQTVSFYGRPKNAPPGADFTIIALPDTQHYTDNPANNQYYHAQTQWIVTNKDALNIQFVTHLGDIVEHGNNNGSNVEWLVADAAMAKLENPVTTLLTNGIAYGLAPGNHDQGATGDGTAGSTVAFNTYFGISRFAGRGYYGGNYGSLNDNNYELFSAGGMDFIIIHFGYDTTPDQPILDWANGLLQTSQRSPGDCRHPQYAWPRQSRAASVPRERQFTMR